MANADSSDSFYNLEKIGGILLFIAALMAIIIANSPWRFGYDNLLNTQASVGFNEFLIKKPLHLWVNDGLMALYFLLIGLEIKREIRHGVLGDKKNIFVPLVVALCGLLVPALIFVCFNWHNALYLQGWAVPTATDIAFTLGILSLLGSRLPLSLKVLLTAIAIFDDIAAIAIIAFFYTHTLSMVSSLLALLFTLILIGLNYVQCRRLSVYMVVGVALWLAVLQSGVHATLAGIVIAMTIPDEKDHSMLDHLENGLHPWIVFFILPTFAFMNAGVTFIGFQPSTLWHPIVLGVAMGLFFGKQIGIGLSLGYFVKFKEFFKQENITLKQVYGMALICGVGFTMSLFIGSLAYQNHSFKLMAMVKIGVVLGSLTSGLLGFLMLKKALSTT